MFWSVQLELEAEYWELSEREIKIIVSTKRIIERDYGEYEDPYCEWNPSELKDWQEKSWGKDLKF